jgi:hypothetical protein
LKGWQLDAGVLLYNFLPYGQRCLMNSPLESLKNFLSVIGAGKFLAEAGVFDNNETSFVLSQRIKRRNILLLADSPYLHHAVEKHYHDRIVHEIRQALKRELVEVVVDRLDPLRRLRFALKVLEE